MTNEFLVSKFLKKLLHFKPYEGIIVLYDHIETLNTILFHSETLEVRLKLYYQFLLIALLKPSMSIEVFIGTCTNSLAPLNVVSVYLRSSLIYFLDKNDNINDHELKASV